MKNKRAKRKLVVEINVVPYIDVTLVLLGFYDYSTPVIARGKS